MNRKRKSNRGLPARVYVKDGSYKYLSRVKLRDPDDGQMKYWIKLATLEQGEGAMLVALGKLVGNTVLGAGTVPHLCAEYAAHRLADYSTETQATYRQYLNAIADDFEEFQVADVGTKHWSEFLRNHCGQLVGGHIRFKPSKTSKTSGLALRVEITAEIADVIERARAFKREHGIVSGYLFPATAGKAAGKPYTKSGLFSMWDRARERAKIADEIQFKDLRALGATDAARQGANKGAIKDRLVHTSEGTTDIYIKDAVPALSQIVMDLPWKRR